MNPRRVVVTGIGAVSPIGIGAETFFTNLLAGSSGVGPITRFDATGYAVRIAAEVKGFDATDFIDKRAARRMDRYSQMAVAAALLAREDAALELAGDRYEAGALVASGVGGLETFYEQTKTLLERGPERLSPLFIPMMIPNMASAHVSMTLGLRGPVSSVSTACAASTNALGDAFQLIRRGDADVMLAGGSEAAVNQTGIGGFAALRALSTRNDEPQKASRPFDADRDGFVLGEGAAVLVLEERERALDRGAHVYAEFLGYGLTADAYHLTEPDETGEPAALAITRTLSMARVEPQEVGYVNAHGTSTPLGDVMETRALRLSLGSAADKVLVSSNKSMIGHCLGAAGGLEAAATVLTLATGQVPPTVNLDTPDPACDLDYVPLVKRELPSLRYALSNSFGFGGHNAAILFGKHE